MAHTVFWSWQSDLDGRVTRHLIREALSIALDRLHAAGEVEERPELDHDTRGVAGLADIVASILGKIDGADIFVADVTPIATSTSGKKVANPNVLIELGYAKKAISPARCITVWNTAFESPTPEDLPFDLRGRRAPIGYCLPPGASRQDRSGAREQLVKDLMVWIAGCLSEIPALPAPAVPWLPHRGDDPKVWFTPGEPFPINLRHGGGANLIVAGEVRWYARMLPTSFDPTSHDQDALGPIVGAWGNWSTGHVDGGSLMFPSPGGFADEATQISVCTLWVRDTGEVWSVESGLVSEWEGRRCFNLQWAVASWTEFLDRVPRHSVANGGKGPFRIKLGVRGLKGLAWPIRSFRSDHATAVTDGVEREFVLQSTDAAERHEHLLDAWTALHRCFSLPKPADADIAEMMRDHG